MPCLCRVFAVIFAIFTKVCRVFAIFCRDFLLSLMMSNEVFDSYHQTYVIMQCNVEHMLTLTGLVMLVLSISFWRFFEAIAATQV